MAQVKLQAASSVSDAAPEPVKLVNAPELIAARAILARAAAENGDNLPSPCISVCRMSKSTDWCEGCFRSIDEIRQWSKSDNAAKLALWQLVEQRAAASVA